MFTPEEIIEHARHFCTGWDFVEIEEIKYVPNFKGGVWHQVDRRAHIKVGMTHGMGVVAHEIFHSAFHNSPLHNSPSESWGDGFCEAYRWLFIERSPAMQADLGRAKKRPTENTSYQLRYSLPAELLLNHCDFNRRRFQEDFATFNRLQKVVGSSSWNLNNLFMFAPGLNFINPK